METDGWLLQKGMGEGLDGVGWVICHGCEEDCRCSILGFKDLYGFV